MFQSSVSNCCDDLSIMSIGLKSIAILNIHGHDYCCLMNGISKSEALHLLQNANLSKTSGLL